MAGHVYAVHEQPWARAGLAGIHHAVGCDRRGSGTSSRTAGARLSSLRFQTCVPICLEPDQLDTPRLRVAAVSCFFPSMSFCLSNLTCSSVTMGPEWDPVV